MSNTKKSDNHQQINQISELDNLQPISQKTQNMKKEESVLEESVIPVDIFNEVSAITFTHNNTNNLIQTKQQLLPEQQIKEELIEQLESQSKSFVEQDEQSKQDVRELNQLHGQNVQESSDIAHLTNQIQHENNEDFIEQQDMSQIQNPHQDSVSEIPENMINNFEDSHIIHNQNIDNKDEKHENTEEFFDKDSNEAIQNQTQDSNKHTNQETSNPDNLQEYTSRQCISDEDRESLMQEILEDKTSKKRKKSKKIKKAFKYKRHWGYILYSKRLLGSIIVLACFIGLYTGYLLFGTTSLQVLWGLNQQKKTLEERVEQSRIENAQLQKKVLELLSLEPD
ncbi:hypothetical protein CQA53_00695 [Helicobacter didelphidarum]|uniref:Transmembrane protein n=1 Tax=Helicobacter didelphidarum TaxID=2040648 RepID=A0A3D8IRM7_9HELI|nr:hypothetical protein [Helicobacter didelphidarum]RDU67565.1 hypothetical protein CQA53_00695 [Helicobacter didelphidarum]